MNIKNKIKNLITAANAKTGESDTTLTDAVQTLVDGYGQGGGGVMGVTAYGGIENQSFGMRVRVMAFEEVE